MKPLILLSFVGLFFISCNKETNVKPRSPSLYIECEIDQSNPNWFTHQDGVDYLYGGQDPNMNFNITNWELKNCGLRFGLGREVFKALITPSFITREEANLIFNDEERFLVAFVGGEAKAYSISLLTGHEVINDMIQGYPIMPAYCVLADLGAVYTRAYCDKVFTFGLSGYTYSDPNVWDGIDAFVLWDRETESLWWPLIDRAVSGSMQNVTLKKFEGGWEDTTWGAIKNKFSNIQVLKSGQTMTPPDSWPHLEGCQ